MIEIKNKMKGQIANEATSKQKHKKNETEKASKKKGKACQNRRGEEEKKNMARKSVRRRAQKGEKKIKTYLTFHIIA